MERIGLAASRIVISGNHMLRKPKPSKIEVVTPKEEEEEEEEEGIFGCISQYTRYSLYYQTCKADLFYCHNLLTRMQQG